MRHTAAMNNKQRGYSLMELIVVMAIVLALSSAGLHGWRQWQQHQRLVQSSRLLLAWLQVQRDEANAFNRDSLIMVVREGTRWCLSSDAAQPDACRAGGRRVWQSQWPDITLAEITTGLTFFGLRNTARPGRITLENPSGRWRAVISVWGRVRLCQVGEPGCQ